MSWLDTVRRAPCIPAVALAVVGILLDRYLEIPDFVWPLVVGVGLSWWLVRQSGMGLVLAIAGLAGLHHHTHCYIFPDDDIGYLASDEPRLVQLRGRIAEPPSVDVPTERDPLRSIPESPRTHVMLDAQGLVDGAGQHRVSGRVATTLLGAKSTLRVDDELQFTGWLAQPRLPDNPGERDYSAVARDQRVRATFLVKHVNDTGVGLTPNRKWTWQSTLSSVRNWSERKLDERLPSNISGLAAALLLGDGVAMARQEWEKYVRTGVVHVLAVSGQHLSILAGLAWVIMRGFGVPRRRGAIAVALGIAFYGTLVGLRPPVLRATVMVLVSCLAMWLRRPSRPGNMMALALLIVLILNPTDLTDPGCQFSFLCMAILIWGLPNWWYREADPFDRIEEQMKPRWLRILRKIGNIIIRAFAATLIFAIAIAPLTAERYHLLSPVGILIGPPAILLASIALVSGFALLLSAAIVPPVALIFAPMVKWSLQLLSGMVDLADRIPGGSFYVGTVEPWWIVGFYVILATVLWLPWAQKRVRWCALVGLTWIIIGLALSLHRPAIDGLRITFLAAGHGGATVLELPDGRVVLCDCGSMSGPDVSRRVIAPFLWHRGIRRVDEVFLSHADLDHFNGLPALMQRFHVGQVSITPSFAAKPTPGVALVIEELKRQRIPVVIRQAGDRMSGGNVDFEVWHPPANGPIGPENARSMVLAIRHEHHCFVLTGDLDLEGRPMVMARPHEPIDVWLAPHHGGRTANPIDLAAWTRPRITVAHNATGEAKEAAENYERVGSRFLGTWPNGAVTIVSRQGHLAIETFRARQAFRLADEGFVQNPRHFPVVETRATGYDDVRSLIHRKSLYVSPSHAPSRCFYSD